VFDAICEEFGKHIKEHIDVYGAYNDQRLTGKHKTLLFTISHMVFQTVELQSVSPLVLLKTVGKVVWKTVVRLQTATHTKLLLLF
jgi:hypothetical protein